ncbi:MAG: peptide-methionine (S)-S-oxide reductase MsrA [Chthoniobacterales bacterium]
MKNLCILLLTTYAAMMTNLLVNNSVAQPALAIFGGGCFWCMDAIFKNAPGVIRVKSGFAGGITESPSYEQVCSGETGHAEVIEVIYDPKKISYDQLLSLFWKAHDPTTLNAQGADHGTQYRSLILTTTPEQLATAEASKERLQKQLADPITTEIKPLTLFYPADEHHQDYYLKNRNAPYCRAVIQPKLKKLGIE